MVTSECLERNGSEVLPRGICNQWLRALGEIHCRFFHGSVSRPVQGKYQCWKCLRQYKIGW